MITDLNTFITEAHRQTAILKSTFNRRYSDYDGVIGDIILEIETLLEMSLREVQALSSTKERKRGQ